MWGNWERGGGGGAVSSGDQIWRLSRAWLAAGTLGVTYQLKAIRCTSVAIVYFQGCQRFDKLPSQERLLKFPCVSLVTFESFPSWWKNSCTIHQTNQVLSQTLSSPVSNVHLFHSSAWIRLTKSAMSWCLLWMMKAKRKRGSCWRSHLHTSYAFFSHRSKLNLKSNSGHFSTLKRNYTSLTVDSPAHRSPHFKGNLCWLCHNLNVLANLRWFTSLCFDFQEQQ